ncbi:hypothetical protein IJH29_00715 [Candidatus Saccharibacteria bacterium]|nr:hypothetical protein [Candidatus Saccharibacteria bacterium]
MGKLFSLVRASMTEGMRIFTYHSRNKKNKNTVPLALAAIAFLSIFGYANALTAALKQSGNEHLILAIFVAATTLLTVVEGIYKSGSLLYSCKDNDLLMSLPLKKAQIVGLRIFKFYVFELLYNSLFLLPAIVAYIIHANNGVEFYLLAITGLITLPIIPVVLSAVIGSITTGISARFKKNGLVQAMLSLGFLFLTVLLAMQAGNLADNAEMAASTLGNTAMQAYYPARLFAELAKDFSAWKLLAFVAANLAIFTLGVVMLARFYTKIVSKVSAAGTVKSNSSELIYKKRSVLGALIKKEIRKYFNTPVLLTNTAFGMVIYLVAVVGISLKFGDLAAELIKAEAPFSLEQLRDFVPLVLMALVIFSSLLTFISATMISLEGKAFNILKTVPVAPITIFLGKIGAAMLLMVPVLVLGEIIMMCMLPFGLMDALLILMGIVIFPLATETLGIIIDLKYARFDAESESEVVKQSTGVMVASFVGLFATVATIAVTVALGIVLGQTLGMVIILVVYIILIAIMAGYLKGKGSERFRDLSA